MAVTSESIETEPYVGRWRRRKAGYSWAHDLEPLSLDSVCYQSARREYEHVPLPPMDAKDAGPFEPPYLVASLPFTKNKEGFEPYDPMAVVGLHRKFALAPPTESGIAKFAKRYGLLGSRTWYTRNLRTDALGDAETFSAWREEIHRTARLVELLDLSRKTESDHLRRLEKMLDLSWDTRSVIRQGWFEAHPEFHESLPYVRAGAAVWSKGSPTLDPYLLARAYVLEHINAQLYRWVSPVVRMDVKEGMGFVPKNLFGAIYLHFANDAMGRTRPTLQCPACRKMFEPKHGTTRYCSQSCRTLAYTRRKRENAREEGTNNGN